jgi:sulfide:quinone oxidoreductase
MPRRAPAASLPAMADTTRVLVAGAGVAAFEAALALRETAASRVRVELVAPETRFWYRPLAVAEPFGLGDVRSFDLPELAAAAGAQLTPGRVVAVDAGAHLAWTDKGAELPFDVILLATGAVPRPTVPGAASFRGPADTEVIASLLRELEEGEVRSVAFCVSPGAGWVLPGYELALLLSAHTASRGLEARIALVTLEEEPLELFGQRASRAVAELLERRGIELHTRAYAAEARDGELRLVPEAVVQADRVVALPSLHGVPIDGVPQTRDGFVVVDDHGRLPGFHHLFAAGDLTSFPVKQGGIATQQADAVAEAIAADAGAISEARPFSPVLRGLLLTGEAPQYLRHEPGAESTVSPEPLWWPPAKIVGRHLAPFLARFADSPAPDDAEAPAGAVQVERRLDREELRRSYARLRAAVAVEESVEEHRAATVGDILAADVLVVAPDDTLGEIAERMRVEDVGSALVADAGRLIGILTSRDLLRAFAGRVHASEARAREWMTSEPLTVEAGTPLPAALRLMTDHAIHHLPVVEGERAVGMVGARQVAHAVAEQRTRPDIGLGL